MGCAVGRVFVGGHGFSCHTGCDAYGGADRRPPSVGFVKCLSFAGESVLFFSFALDAAGGAIPELAFEVLFAFVFGRRCVCSSCWIC